MRAQITEVHPRILEIAQPRHSCTFSSGYDFMMRRDKLKLRTWFEIYSFSRCRSDKGERPKMGKPYIFEETNFTIGFAAHCFLFNVAYDLWSCDDENMRFWTFFMWKPESREILKQIIILKTKQYTEDRPKSLSFLHPIHKAAIGIITLCGYCVAAKAVTSNCGCLRIILIGWCPEQLCPMVL